MTVKKTCIFVAGEAKVGKTSMIRALTGTWKESFRKVKDLNGKPILALAILSSIGERKPVLPEEFPKQLEINAVGKSNLQDYQLLLCPIRSHYKKNGGVEAYFKAAKERGFDVKVAGVEIDWNGVPSDLSKIQALCTQNNIPYLAIDASNDYTIEASKLRQAFYPR